jgi:hypothetical protein
MPTAAACESSPQRGLQGSGLVTAGSGKLGGGMAAGLPYDIIENSYLAVEHIGFLGELKCGGPVHGQSGAA